MRDLLLVAMVFALCVPALRWPHVGLLAWLWMSIMAPHFLSYGFSKTIPLVQIVAITTFIGMLLNYKNIRSPFCAFSIFNALFIIWFTITTIMALDPEYSYWRYDRSIKLYIVVFLMVMLLTSKVRIQATVWILFISMAFYMVKGGLFTILTGGSWRVWGPPGSPIGDNNYTAACLLMVVPLGVYLFRTSAQPLLRIAILATVFLGIFAAIGTHSRGGLLGLATVIAVYMLMSRQKIIVGVVAVLSLLVLVNFVPENWVERMETITEAQEDGSFQQRLKAWEFAILVANDRVFGAGFSGTEVPHVFLSYLPDGVDEDKPAAAAHSVYFQLLGDHGWIGLGLYLTMLLIALWNTMWVRGVSRRRPDLYWAFELATACLVAIAGYMVTGAALSLTQLDLPLAVITLTALLRLVVLDILAEEAPRTVPRGRQRRGLQSGRSEPALSRRVSHG